MRFARPLALIAVIAAGCGGPHPPAHGAPPPVASAFPATRWVPAKPTYVLASPTFKAAQRSFRDVIESLGILGGVDVSDVSRDLQKLLAVDPLSPDPVSALGVDLDGGIVMFSEDVSPTFVVHLAAPEQMQAFFDRQRERGLVTQSVIVDGTEIFTAQLGVRISWAVAADWLWIHFTLPGTHEDATAWFTSSHRPDGPTWSRDWAWAQNAAGKASSALVGFINAHDVIASVVSRVPEAIGCAKLLAPISRVGIAIEGDGHIASGRVTIDIGGAAQTLAAQILPIPEGWAAAAATAPLAAQWNLDVLALRGWIQPCAKVIGEDLGVLDKYGVRSGRAMIQAFDPDAKTGAGAVSLDLAHKKWLADKLDDIPLRSTLERDRTYGPLAGHSISIPFGPTVDYILTDHVAYAAVGDGLLGGLVGRGKGTPGPLAAIDLAPPAMSTAAWQLILEQAGIGRSHRLVERLMRWHDGHIAVTIEGTSLVVAASGTRR